MNPKIALNRWKNEIISISLRIDEALAKHTKNEIADGIMPDLENFVEAVVFFIYADKQKNNLNAKDPRIEDCLKMPETKFINGFYKKIKASRRLNRLDHNYSEMVLSKYLSSLMEIKTLLKTKYDVDALLNLKQYPLDMDNSLVNYYKKISSLIYSPDVLEIPEFTEDSAVYVIRKKPVFVDGKQLYEYTLIPVKSAYDKFKRFIAYSRHNIFDNYAIKYHYVEKTAILFDKVVPITIITKYKVAIRNCELQKLGRIILGVDGERPTYTDTAIYNNVMDYVKLNRESLAEILRYNDEDYADFINQIIKNSKSETTLQHLLDKTRKTISSDKPGVNVLTYLWACSKNKVLRNQISDKPEPEISNFYLNKGDLVFNRTPFSAYLVRDYTEPSILFQIFDNEKYEDDIFAMNIRDESTASGVLYLDYHDKNQEDVSYLIEKYNDRLRNKKIDKMALLQKEGCVYIKGNEDASVDVLNDLLNRTKTISNKDYSIYVDGELSRLSLKLDDQLKEEAIKTMFANSDLYCIYGSAGTGKSTLIGQELQVCNNIFENVICLAQTHSAVVNMKNRINSNEAKFVTINQFKKTPVLYKNQYTLAVIDECSIIGTNDMAELLKKLRAKYLILAGDTFQLPSIRFGNWFSILRQFIDKKCMIDLDKNYRAKNNIVLKNLWDKVRNLDEDIQEYIDSNNISHDLNTEILAKKDEDEIILALNYNGPYGINNINNLLQIDNPHEAIKWKQYTFKVGDPIIFTENEKFDGALYNNLKGFIDGVEVDGAGNITFTLKVNCLLTRDRNYKGFKFIKLLDKNTSLISIEVKNNNSDELDNDERKDGLYDVPFQIAYATSIHKSQGLEYKSVKIVITEEIEEMISHNVFYTAITRASEKLAIYWSKKSEKNIIEAFKINNVNKDARIIKPLLNI